MVVVAIHAPHAGGDRGDDEPYSFSDRVAIHAPHAGGDQVPEPLDAEAVGLRSTPPTREATTIWRSRC